MAGSRFSDLAIRDRILALLEAHGRAVPLEVVGREVFRLRTPQVAFLRQMMHRLFGEDPQVIVRGDDSVEWKSEERASWPLRESEYVVLDVETTGGHPPHDRVIEIAAIRLVGWEARLGEAFVTVVNPERVLPRAIVRLTGITEAMVRRAPRFEEIAAEFLAFVGRRVVVAHHARFDMAFLNAELQRVMGRRLENPTLCTLALSRRLFPELPNHRLPTVVRALGIEMGRWHRALPDAHATARLFLRMLDLLEERGIRTLEDVRRGRRAMAHRD